MGIKLSELQQKSVWEGWLSAEIRAHYFADRCARYNQTLQVLTWIGLASSSSALVSMMAALPPEWAWLRLILALVTALVSLWGVVRNYHRRITECSDLHHRWNTLGLDYEALWDGMYAPDAVTKLESLKQRGAELAKSSTHYPNEPKVMRRWQQHVLTHRGIEAAA